MAVRIRLTRTGRKNLPQWRVAVFDSRTRRDGKFLEMLGLYLPHEKPEKKFRLDVDRYKHWLSMGALPSPAVDRLLKHAKALEAKAEPVGTGAAAAPNKKK
jgi:small subunit ribosomal protein S16